MIKLIKNSSSPQNKAATGARVHWLIQRNKQLTNEGKALSDFMTQTVFLQSFAALLKSDQLKHPVKPPCSLISSIALADPVQSDTLMAAPILLAGWLMTALKYNNYQVSCFSDQSITTETNRSQLGESIGHFLTQLHTFTILHLRYQLLSVFGNQYLLCLVVET